MNEWRELVQEVNNKEQWIITGDFTVHNASWNCKDTDKNCSKLHEAMEEKGIYIVNDSTIGDQRRKEKNLDLMFASEDIVEGIRYREEEDSWGSDHIPVIIKIRYESKNYVKKSNRLSSGKTDWEKYKKGVRQEEMIGNNGYEVMERYNRLCNIMKKEICIATGKMYKKDKEEKDRDKKANRKNKRKRVVDEAKRQQIEWWDKECEEVIKKKKKKLKEFLRYRTMDKYEEFSQCNIEVRKIL